MSIFLVQIKLTRCSTKHAIMVLKPRVSGVDEWSVQRAKFVARQRLTKSVDEPILRHDG